MTAPARSQLLPYTVSRMRQVMVERLPRDALLKAIAELLYTRASTYSVQRGWRHEGRGRKQGDQNDVDFHFSQFYR